MFIYHFLGHFLYYYSPAIQSVCAVLGLLGLGVYAFDTRAIRNATLAQSDASRRPFLDLIANEFSAIGNNAYSVQNNGAGPAISVAWAPAGIPNAALLYLGSLSIRAKADLGGHHSNLDEQGFSEHGNIVMVYSDTSGRDYVQLFAPREDSSIRNVVLDKYSSRRDASEVSRFRAGTSCEWQARYLGNNAGRDADQI